MTDIRVLAVDDSAVVRRLLVTLLQSETDLEVTVAGSGFIALQKIARNPPDIVILDVEMAGIDGLETLKRIRALDPHLPVVMFSVHTERGVGTTLDALSLGASDYMQKPTNLGDGQDQLESTKRELVEKIRALSRPVSSPRPSSSKTLSPFQRTPGNRKGPTKPIEILVLGVSTGGPNALSEIIPRLTADFPVPILVVQHMPAMFTTMLSERLDRKSSLRVAEGQHQTLAQPGEVWLAPGGFHMTVEKHSRGVRLLLDQGAPVNSCRPSVDPLFESAAREFRDATLGIVLTGMGRDGCRGCTAIREESGYILAQDKETSVVWGMPGAVVERGLADEVLPLPEFASACTRIVRISRGETTLGA